jgi:hypothetical protein
LDYLNINRLESERFNRCDSLTYGTNPTWIHFVQ